MKTNNSIRKNLKNSKSFTPEKGDLVSLARNNGVSIVYIFREVRYEFSPDFPLGKEVIKESKLIQPLGEAVFKDEKERVRSSQQILNIISSISRDLGASTYRIES